MWTMSDLVARSRDQPRLHAFRAHWQAGERPRIEGYLADCDDIAPEVLLEELLLLDIFHRRRLGETPVIDEYRVRFPHIEVVWLEEALAESAARPTETQVDAPDGGG